MAKIIKLTKGYEAIVDDEDFESANKYKWYADIKKGVIYARRNANNKNEYEYLHRFILKQKDKHMKVDHINHDGLDCQRGNLRSCTHRENLLNRKGGHGSSLYLGVRREKGKIKNKWVSEYNLHRKHFVVGYFENEIDAAVARDNAVRIAHGTFATLNFPENIKLTA